MEKSKRRLRKKSSLMLTNKKLKMHICDAHDLLIYKQNTFVKQFVEIKKHYEEDKNKLNELTNKYRK